MIPPTAYPIFALALSLLLPVPGDEEVKEAASLFGKPSEADAKKGCGMLVIENSPEAVDVLIENLARIEGGPGGGYLDPSHYRDVAWVGLEQITDIYAKRAAEVRIKDRRADPLLRSWLIRLVGVWQETSFGDTVERGLKDKDLRVQREAARTLGILAHEPAAKSLSKLARHKDPFLRANAIEALARIDLEAWRKQWNAGLEDKDGGVRCALLGAAPEADPENVERISLDMLEDDDWRPRAQAVENLGGIRTKGSVDGLLKALEDPRATVRERALASLARATHQNHRNPSTWNQWWADSRESFAFPEGEPAQKPVSEERTQVTYHSIPVTSDRVAFLIDTSQSMGATMTSREGKKGEVARSELEALLTRIQAMEHELDFNVYTYNQEVEVLFPKKPGTLAKKTQRQALAFVEEANQTGLKDIWQVLEMVVQDPELDTIYLLSSGEPEVGLYVHWQRVTDHLADLNRFHKVVVHSIAFSDSDWYKMQLEKIAEVTGGEFQFFE